MPRTSPTDTGQPIPYQLVAYETAPYGFGMPDCVHCGRDYVDHCTEDRLCFHPTKVRAGRRDPWWMRLLRLRVTLYGCPDHEMTVPPGTPRPRYEPRQRTVPPPAVDDVMVGARAWVAECTWADMPDPEDVEYLDDDEVRAGVDRHYAGGWAQFVIDFRGGSS